MYYQQQSYNSLEIINNKNFLLITLYNVHNAHNICKWIPSNCEHIPGVTVEDGGIETLHP